MINKCMWCGAEYEDENYVHEPVFKNGEYVTCNTTMKGDF